MQRLLFSEPSHDWALVQAQRRSVQFEDTLYEPEQADHCVQVQVEACTATYRALWFFRRAVVVLSSLAGELEQANEEDSDLNTDNIAPDYVFPSDRYYAALLAHVGEGPAGVIHRRIFHRFLVGQDLPWHDEEG